MTMDSTKGLLRSLCVGVEQLLCFTSFLAGEFETNIQTKQGTLGTDLSTLEAEMDSWKI